MTIFYCEQNWEAMLTCIFEASASKVGYKNIKFEINAPKQPNFLDTYIEVKADGVKAQKVIDAICNQISVYVYEELAFCSMSKAPDVLDNIYRVLILGFHYGPQILNMVQFKDVMRNREIRKALGNEVHHFIEFIRFHELNNNLLVAHIEPKSRLIQGLGYHFSDRMPSLDWMIVDDNHKEAIIHPKDEKWYVRNLTEEEYSRLLETESVNDEYTDMWRTFFRSIAIKERENYTCQRNLFPIWTRKHAVEFLS